MRPRSRQLGILTGVFLATGCTAPDYQNTKDGAVDVAASADQDQSTGPLAGITNLT